MNSMSEDWKNLPIGAWFFCDSPNCTNRYSVQERTSGGCSIVCSTPFHHEPAKRDMEEIAKLHNQVTQAAPVSPHQEWHETKNDEWPDDEQPILAEIAYFFQGKPVTEIVACFNDGEDLKTMGGDDIGWTVEVIIRWIPLPTPVTQAAPVSPRLQSADQFFDDCKVYFELPMGGNLEDATEFLAGFDTEVRLAAIAFAKAYAEYVDSVTLTPSSKEKK